PRDLHSCPTRRSSDLVVHEVPARDALFAGFASALAARANLLVAEPKGHVPGEDFARTLSVAKEHGFVEVGTPQISRSYAVLLKRSEEHTSELQSPDHL